MKKKYQILNVITLTIGIILCVFGLLKIAYYNSYRPLGVVDYLEINDYTLCLISTILLFISVTIYNKKQKLKILTIILYCITTIVFILNTRYYMVQAYYVFTSDLWLPNNVDYFTSLFESISNLLFSLYLITIFIYKISTKYFQNKKTTSHK